MGATYTRQSSYTDGDVITAAHTNDEFNQLLAAFQASSGHTHDGTANEGGPITKLLGNTLTFGAGTAGTMMLNKLHNVLDKNEWQITIVDQHETHYILHISCNFPSVHYVHAAGLAAANGGLNKKRILECIPSRIFSCSIDTPWDLTKAAKCPMHFNAPSSSSFS